MKKSLIKLINLFPAIRSADHLNHEWDAEEYRLDDEESTSGMSRYPALLVDSKKSVTLAEWNWMAMPQANTGWTQGGNHAYMLSTRRI